MRSVSSACSCFFRSASAMARSTIAARRFSSRSAVSSVATTSPCNTLAPSGSTVLMVKLSTRGTLGTGMEMLFLGASSPWKLCSATSTPRVTVTVAEGAPFFEQAESTSITARIVALITRLAAPRWGSGWRRAGPG